LIVRQFFYPFGYPKARLEGRRLENNFYLPNQESPQQPEDTHVVAAEQNQQAHQHRNERLRVDSKGQGASNGIDSWHTPRSNARRPELDDNFGDIACDLLP
jgi:hypothetical protein